MIKPQHTIWRGWRNTVKKVTRTFISNRQPQSVSRGGNASKRMLFDQMSPLMYGEYTDAWSYARYGEYYAISAPVHAAVRVLAEAISRPQLKVWIRPSPDADHFQPASIDHPLQKLLDQPHPAWSRAELWRTIESRLALWGSAFVALKRNEIGKPQELWPLPSDQVRVIADEDEASIRGFIHESINGRTAYLPEDVLWFRRFNPINTFAGMSSVAPPRIAIDMGAEALKFNRRFFINSAAPSDLVLKVDVPINDQQAEEIYNAWAKRVSEPHHAHRPLILSAGMDLKRLGTTHKDMEFMATLEWSVEEVARTFGVPKVFLSEFEDATLANVRTMEQFLWRNTIIPELQMLEDGVNQHLAPSFSDFPNQLQARFDLSSVEAVQESADDRANRLASLVASGIMSIDEARAELGMA